MEAATNDSDDLVERRGISRHRISSPSSPPVVVRFSQTAERLTILVLGPATNVASALATDRNMMARVERIVFVAGQQPNERFFPGPSLLHLHDLNARKDLDAAAHLLASPARLTLVTYAAASTMPISAADLARLERRGERGRFLAALSQPWLEFWNNAFGRNAFFPFDAAAVVYAEAPSMLTCEPAQARIVRRRSIFVERSTLEVGTGGAPVTWCRGASPSATKALLSRFEGTP